MKAKRWKLLIYFTEKNRLVQENTAFETEEQPVTQ